MASTRKRPRLKATSHSISDNQGSRISAMKNGKDDSVRELTGKSFLQEFNGSSWRGRHMKRAYNEIVSDLGGKDHISFAQSEIARRCAAMHVLAMESETALALFDEANFDAESYIILARAQSQLFKQLGMERKQRKVEDAADEPPTLEEYLSGQKT